MFNGISSIRSVYVYKEYEILSFNSVEEIKHSFLERFGQDAYNSFKIDGDLHNNGLIFVIFPSIESLKKFRQTITPERYNPFEETPDLYTEMAKLNDLDYLFRFVNVFGIPIGNHINEPIINTIKIDYATANDIAYASIMMKNLTELWYGIQTNDIYLMSKFIEELSKVPQNPVATIMKIFGDDVSWIAKKTLASYMNFFQNSVISIDVAGDKIRPVAYCNNLFEVAINQFIQAVIHNIPLKRCEQCGSLFELRHSSRRFCPPFKGNKRSTCENTYNARQRRLRKS